MNHLFFSVKLIGGHLFSGHCVVIPITSLILILNILNAINFLLLLEANSTNSAGKFIEVDGGLNQVGFNQPWTKSRVTNNILPNLQSLSIHPFLILLLLQQMIFILESLWFIRTSFANCSRICIFICIDLM